MQKQQCKITSYTYDLGLPSTIANDLNLASKVNKDVHNGDCISSTDYCSNRIYEPAIVRRMIAAQGFQEIASFVIT